MRFLVVGVALLAFLAYVAGLTGKERRTAPTGRRLPVGPGLLLALAVALIGLAIIVLWLPRS